MRFPITAKWHGLFVDRMSFLSPR